MKKEVFAQHIHNADFKSLFNEFGWDFKPLARNVVASDQTFSLEAVAEKRDFYVMRCSPATDGRLPDANVRRSISRQFEKVKNFHLLLFTDHNNSEQIWQVIVRLPNRPTKFVETRWQRGQDVELLYQKARGLLFDLDEEGDITIVDVMARVQNAAGANADKVTKKFYDGFKKEHTEFLEFISGIETQVNREWYASLMLNRLMFCYFIQKKRFLDNNPNYLNDKLAQVRALKGNGKFYSFYRDFLLVLFHQGLNNSSAKPELIGNVPYLNGGLFDIHELETQYPDIQVPDEAFERIFKFFDQYEWHLDNRPGRSGNEVNPDVIGYIFEKYINARADMGAYYTKEDITDYISKNCIIPFLFDETERKGANLKPAFQLLHDDPDHYIYPALRHGITYDYHRSVSIEAEVPLPDDVAAGLDTDAPNLVLRRKCWNREAPPEAGLPTEWWREVVERRARYRDVRQKIQNGEVTQINDLITLNLDIRQFAQNALHFTDDPVFLRHFFQALQRVSVLDPTCGSGAFLFAALNILEPLYEICLGRMTGFVETQPGRFKDFEATLADANNTARHPNLEYYIYKKIIVQNLYGVDIMREATEIAKLRLFLKLMSTVEADRRKPNLGLEPLPDVDFNIRAGNTLVGFASLAAAEEAINQRDQKPGQQGRLVFGDELEVVAAVREKADLVARAFARFQDAQVVTDAGSDSHRNAKADLRRRLADLNDALNTYLAFQYGVERERKAADYNKWLAAHQPFHWFAEFYDIVHNRRGFDCVIGNPPYVEYAEVKKHYQIINYLTLDCGNLFAFIPERVEVIRSSHSAIGMIVPISSISTPRMKPFQEKSILLKGTSYVSNFAVRPGKLFEGVDMNLTIFLNVSSKEKITYTTQYNRWYQEERDFLFHSFSYGLNSFAQGRLFPKLQLKIEIDIYSSLLLWSKTPSMFVGSTQVFYHSGGRYFRKCIQKKLSAEYKPLNVPHGCELVVQAILSSSLFYWFWITISDTYHVTKRDVEMFFTPPNLCKDQALSMLGSKLDKDIWNNSKTILRNRKDGSQSSEVNFYIGKSKPILDEIDTVLAEHYGFTQEELDFIINYDIKYRMGKGSGEEE